jgi:hypothetical protein
MHGITLPSDSQFQVVVAVVVNAVETVQRKAAPDGSSGHQSRGTLKSTALESNIKQYYIMPANPYLSLVFDSMHFPILTTD